MLEEEEGVFTPDFEIPETAGMSQYPLGIPSPAHAGLTDNFDSGAWHHGYELSPTLGAEFGDDGTIHIGSNKIRLQGINAPELDEPYGKQAKWALHKLVKGQTITAHPSGEESYGRIVAKCFLEDGRDIAAEMVKMGLALDLPNYPDADYKHLETPASRKKLGWKPKKKREE